MVFVPKNKKRSRGRKVAFKPKNQTFAKRVQAIVNKNVESKQAFHSLSGSFNSGIATASGSEVMQLIPNIVKSLDDNGRVGDQIRAQQLYVDGFISMNLNYTTAASARIAVRMMIVQPKNLGLLSNLQNNTNSWMTTLIKKGGTTTSFTGVLDDLYAPINTEAITKYYDKVFYLNLPYMNTAVGETSTSSSTKYFRITKNLRNKLLCYDTTYSATSPVTFNPVLLLGYVHTSSGSTPDTLNTQAFMSYSSRLTYQDA